MFPTHARTATSRNGSGAGNGAAGERPDGVASSPGFRIETQRTFLGAIRGAEEPVVRLEIVARRRAEDAAAAAAGTVAGTLAAAGMPVPGAVPDDEIRRFLLLVETLLREALHEVRVARVEACGGDDRFRVDLVYEDATAVLEAAALGAELMNAPAERLGRDSWPARLGEFVARARGRALDANARLLAAAARERGLPVVDLDRAPYDEPAPGREIGHGLIRIGHGARGRRFLGAAPEGLAPEQYAGPIAREAVVTALEAAGLRTPRRDRASSVADGVRAARRAAERIGFPVSVRPAERSPFDRVLAGVPVYAPLHEAATVSIAARHLLDRGGRVWVESAVGGEVIRVLVLGGRAIAAATWSRPSVVGDAEHTVDELIAAARQAAASPLARRAWDALVRGDADVETRLALAGLARGAVPARGQRIVLRGAGTPHDAGACRDAMHAASPACTSHAVRAAAACGLARLAGVDLVLGEDGPVVLDVVPFPDLLVHVLAGAADVPGRVLDALFRGESAGRIPLVAVTGTNGKTTTSRMVAHMLRAAGLRVGLACTNGVLVDGEEIAAGDLAGPGGALSVLTDPRTDAAVLETARGALATQGRAFARCDVGICTNVAQEHIGEHGLETVHAMAVHKRQIIECARAAAILNADDPECLAMVPYASARHTVLVSMSSGSPAIDAHLAAGHTAVVLDGDADRPRLVLRSGAAAAVPLVTLEEIPATASGTAAHNAFNVACAAAAAWALDVPIEVIRGAMRTCEASATATPARLNEFHGLPFRVVVDAARNPHALEAMAAYVSRQAVHGRRIVVTGGSGRRDADDYRRGAAALAGHFDLYIARYTRHRGLDDDGAARIVAAFADTWRDRGVRPDQIAVFLDSRDALHHALTAAAPGDLLVVFVSPGLRDEGETRRILQAAVERLR